MAKHKHKKSAGCSHSAWCAIDQQEGDSFNASSSSHLNKFKIGLFFSIYDTQKTVVLEKARKRH